MKPGKKPSPAQAAQQARATRRQGAIKRRGNIADVAAEWWHIHGQGLSIDRLLCRPSMSLKMVRYVRCKFKDAQEAEICEAFLSARKAGKFQTEKKK